MVRCLENIRRLEGAPSVPLQDVPADFFPDELSDYLISKRGPSEFLDN